MEKAVWEGKVIYASKVKDDWPFEKFIKLENKNGVLRCPDKSCSSPIMIYCHGKKRRPYFAHKHKTNCDYDKYERKNTELISDIKNSLYELLVKKDFTVDVDVKIFEHQYAHVVYYMNGVPFVIELVQDSVTARRVSCLFDQYQNNSISVQFLLIADDDFLENESETNFIRRFSLNESYDKSLLIINKEGTRVSQYRFDEFEYKYRGSFLAGYPSIYTESNTFESLTIEKNSLTIKGFDKRYNDWFEERQKRYNEFITPKSHIKTNTQIKEKIDTNICNSNENFVGHKEILTKSRVVEYDTTEIKDVAQLKFIEKITLPTGKPPVELFVWTEEDFFKKIEQVCYKEDVHAFKLLLNKFRIVSEEEKIIINKLWTDFKEHRPDYFYVIKTAYKKTHK